MFRMPKEGTIEFDDIVKGKMAKKAEDIQDFAIVRSDGSPIFHIANVVDDIDQRVSHIIRGDDHVENTFKHICMFKALGAERKPLVVLPAVDAFVVKSCANIQGAKTCLYNTINVYDILNADTFITTVAAVKMLEEVYA